MKTYPQSVLDMFESGNVKYAYLLSIEFDQITVRYTNAGFTVNYNGNDYIDSPQLNGISELSRNANMTVTELQVNLSLANNPAANAVYLSSIYNTPVNVERVFLDENNQSIHSENVWKGKVASYADSDEDLLLTLNVSNIWADFDSSNPWRTTPSSHKRRFADDNCFKFAAKASEVVYWGENPTLTDSGDR